MTSISYYFLTEDNGNSLSPDCLNLYYSDKKNLIDIAIKNYKPSFNLKNIRSNLALHGEYQNYSSLHEFSEFGTGVGYFDIILGETEYEIEEDTIKFFSKLSIQFTDAKRIYTPEIKTAGLPYQPAKTEVKIIHQFDPVPLFMCKKYCQSYTYSTKSNMDDWAKTERAVAFRKLFISQDTIYIH